MSFNLLITSPVWTAAGWTMLHVIWVGAAIGVVAALVRGLLNRARSQTRYSVALAFLLALSISPAAIFVAIFQPDSGSRAALIRPTAHASARSASLTNSERQPTNGQAVGAIVVDERIVGPPRSRLDSLVTLLPWIWLCGSLSTLVMLATGLIGVEQMRRSSRLVESGELPRRCRALADSLGIARRVSVGICDRLAMPVLVGIVRPLILLPPAALCGWSVEQLEMVLLHELGHVKRWDNLVNLLQRVVESVLFFHPVVWWLSGWVRLERELCCDCVVIERVGQPIAYAEMLIALSGTRRCCPSAVLAMADRQVLTRIRRLLNLEERSMKLTMPEGLGSLGAVIVGLSLVLGTQAQPPRRPSDSTETILQNSKSQCMMSLFPRDERRLEITLLPRTPEGVFTYICRGGIEIVRKLPRGTIRIAAEAAEIRCGPQQTTGKLGPNGEIWVKDKELPIKVCAKGNVVVHQDEDEDEVGRKGDRRNISAPQLEYDFVTDCIHVFGPGLFEKSNSGLPTTTTRTASRVDVCFVRKPDGSIVPAELREIRARDVIAPEPTNPPSPSAKTKDSASSEF